MANVQITQLPAALPLDGTELVPVVQGGVTVRTTTGAVAGSPNLQQSFLTVNNEPTLPNSRYLTADPGISVTDGGAQSTLNLALTGAADSLNNASTGVLVKDSGSTVVSRSIAASGAGLSVSNGTGVSGNPTVSLTGQAANFASASGGGLVTLSSGGAVSSTSILGTAGEIAVANGDGIVSNPTVSLVPTGVTPGTYGSSTQIPVVTVDDTGRLTNVVATSISGGGTVTQINTGYGLTGGPITSSGTIAVDTSAIATVSTPQTLTNKSISGALNTLSAIPNSSLTYSTITVNGTTISLGGSGIITAAVSYPLTIGTGLSGTSYDGSAPVTIAIDSSVATLTGSQTLTNKTISGANNTLSNIGNSSLTNSSVTINGSSVSLGGSTTVTAVNPNALTIGTGLTGTSYDGSAAVTVAIDSSVATLTGTQTLTNKSISGSTNTLTNIPNNALTNSSLTVGSTAISLGGTSLTLDGLTYVGLTQDPTLDLQAATKQYVDAKASTGLTYHAPVQVATTQSLAAQTGGTVTYNQPGGPGVGVGATITLSVALTTLDGYSLSNTNRILVKDETNQAYNGVYTWATGGTVLTRATDADTYGSNVGQLSLNDYFFVQNGTVNKGSSYVVATPGTITFGTTSIIFEEFSNSQVYSAGTGLTLTGTTFSITNTGVSNGSYGTASSVPTLAINAQGQITSASNTSIAINGNQITSGTVGSAYISGSYTGITGVGTLTAGTWNATPITNTYLANSSVTVNGTSISLGGSATITAVNPNALTIGTHLTGSSYDGSSAVTIATDATDANTASTIVSRDASGNFSAGTISAALNGNASTSTTSTNLASGSANQIPYQTGSSTTSFITAPTVTSTYLQWNGSAFTWATVSGSGTVTSVDVSGGTTGLTFSGGPVTSSGTITMAGTLGVTNGGTGQTSYTDGQLLIGNSTGNTLSKATLTPGSGISITNGSGSITIANSSPMTYPGAGIPNSTGSAWGTSYSTTGSGTVVALATSPSFTTPTLGDASATSINKVAITAPATGSTLTIADGKTLTANNSLTLSGTDSTTMTFPSTSTTLAGLGVSQTFTQTNTFPLVNFTNNAVTVSSNAGTVPITSRLNTFTNSSAAGMTITMATASAVDGQMSMVRIYDFSAAAQTITWVNTENSTVTAPTTSNGSTTLPLTVGFMYNGQTSKWRCIASA